MRVGLDGIPLASIRTGIGHYTFELAQALAHLSPTDEFELISPVPPVGPLAGDRGEQLPSNLHLVRTGTHLLWWTVGLPFYGRNHALSVFHGTNYELPFGRAFAGVVTIHDLSLLLHPETHRRPLVRRAERRLPRVALAATMVITATESVKRELVELLGIDAGKIAVTPYAPRKQFRPMRTEETVEVRRRLGVEDEFVLCVGTIEPRKNLITLVKALEEILHTTPFHPQVVVVGNKGWLTDDLFSYIRDSGLDERIRFVGYVMDEDLCALYSSCVTCVYPSVYEGFGLPPLEAMACGAPVITSRTPSIMETVGTAASLISPTSVPDLAQSIIELLKNEEKRKHLSLAGHQRAAEFTWEKTAQATMDVYHEAIERKRRES